MCIEATRQIGSGQEIKERSGRTWEYRNYESPSGPAFWLTLPGDLCPDGTAGYTVHFDGVMGVVQEVTRG